MRKRFPYAGAPIVREVRAERGDWSPERDARLAALCLTPASYDEITNTLNAEFKDEPRKTRNATLGRANRKGYSAGKPSAPGRATKRKSNGKPTMIDKTKARRIKNTADDMLRAEGDPGRQRYRRSKVLASSHPIVQERRKGNLPAIIEEQPATSVLLTELDRGACMWPTNDAATEVCGQPAKIGAYCAHHAQSAFRVMPTSKRNRVRDKEDREHEVRIDGSHHRSQLDPDGAWLNAQLMAFDEVTVNSEDDGIAPLAIPFFLEKLT